MFYGLDVQRAFIQVSGIDERGDERVRCRVAATIEAIAAFADSLNSEDEVVLEATFHTWAIWALLKEHVEKVIVANPLQVRAIAAAKIKTDRFPLTEAAASPKPAQPAYWDDGTSTVVHLAATPDATVACATDYDGLLTEASIPIMATLATDDGRIVEFTYPGATRAVWSSDGLSDIEFGARALLRISTSHVIRRAIAPRVFHAASRDTASAGIARGPHVAHDTGRGSGKGWQDGSRAGRIPVRVGVTNRAGIPLRRVYGQHRLEQ